MPKGRIARTKGIKRNQDDDSKNYELNESFHQSTPKISKTLVITLHILSMIARLLRV